MVGQRFYSVIRAVVRPFFAVLFPCKYVNRNNLPKNGNYILCSNHIANIDPILIALGQKRQFVSMAKEELFRNKFVGSVIKFMGAFPVKRGKGDNGALDYAQQALIDGKAMLIFFEGTRSKTGELLRPKTGVSVIAYQTKTPIIPVCITPKHSKIKIFRKNIITYGEPIMPEDFGIESGTGKEYRNLSRKIMERVTEMRKHDKKLLLGSKYVEVEAADTEEISDGE